MANHKSSIKRIRSTEAKRLRNRFQEKSTRTMIKRLSTIKNKEKARKLLLTVSSNLDKLAKKNIIHKNTASNQKSRLTKYVNSISIPAAKETISQS